MYVLTLNDEVVSYPYSVDELVRSNPQVSFPTAPSIKLLNEYGVHIVVFVGTPEYDPELERLVEVNPVWSGERWERSYEVQAKGA
jgi:hypothetical protein